MIRKFKHRLKQKFKDGRGKQSTNVHDDNTAGTLSSAASYTTQAGQRDEVSVSVLSVNNTAPPVGSSMSGWMNSFLNSSLRMLRILGVLMNAPRISSFVGSFDEGPAVMEKRDLERHLNELRRSIESLREREVLIGKEDLEQYLDCLMESIHSLTKEGQSSASKKLKDGLNGLYSSLSEISANVREGEDDDVYLEGVSREITQAVDSFMLVNCFSGIINLTDTLIYVQGHVLGQRVQNLPHVDAAYDDYKSKKKSGACFEGTREALLKEIAEWIVALTIAQIYLLSGIAGTGKSTIAYTVAERARQSGYLGASFFFSRDEASRSNAEKFFTTIAFQLCLFDQEFSREIEAALVKKEGAAAVTKAPEEQLKALILDPLRDILKSRSSPIVIVVDALDECDEKDAPAVLRSLSRLMRELPCFKIIVTTRPQPHLPPIPSAHKVFYLQNIEDKLVDSDIRRYLDHNLSWEQVKASLLGLENKWSASAEEIDFLVQASGRLFIIASTAVRFILDSAAYDPNLQLEALRGEGGVSLEHLDNFYSVILRRAVPHNKPAIQERFKIIIGTIMVIQEPLPIDILGHLTQPWSSSSIKASLANLQSVIMLNNDTPLIYHKSLSDYLTNPLHCHKDLLIDIVANHTRLATCCLEIMNRNLKQNILDLGTPARFMDNDDGLVADQITEERLKEKIPGILKYACTYWANHIEGADAKDFKLIQEMYTFMMEHLLHWLEALSLIGKLDVAYPAVRSISKLMKPTSALNGIFSDALRFISRFSTQIRRSALHAYYSALPFTPAASLLSRSYSKEMIHGVCQPEGIPPQWDAVVSHYGAGLETRHLIFSRDSSKFASSSEDRREMRLWDAENGTLLQIYEGDSSGISNDFSVVAVSQGCDVTLWSVASEEPVAALSQSGKVVALALSSDGSRLAVGMSNSSVNLWDAGKGKLIGSLGGYASGEQLGFAPSRYGLAFASDDGKIWLWNGADGGLITKLNYKMKKHSKFVFSLDGRRLATLVEKDEDKDAAEGAEGGYSLTLWDAESGNLIDVADEVGGEVAASEDGSLIATGGRRVVKLWGGNPLSLVDVIDIGGYIDCLAISHDILAIGSADARSVTVYDIGGHAVIATFRSIPKSVALSPDCTRLVPGNVAGRLFDLGLIRTSPKPQHRGSVTALAFSLDSSRLASGFEDGTVVLWDTNETDHPIADRKLHSKPVSALAYSFDGAKFSSGSEDGTVRFWDGRDCSALGNTLGHSFTDTLTSVAFSPNLFAVSTTRNITLFNHTSLLLVSALDGGGHSLSFSSDGSLLAAASQHAVGEVRVWNIEQQAVVATFTGKSDIHRLTFSPDCSQLVAQSTWEDGSFEFFDLANNRAFELTGHENLTWVPNFINGILISSKKDVRRSRLLGQFPGYRDQIPVLWIPEDMSVYCFEVGSSILALGGNIGQIVFVRFPTASDD